MTAITGSIGSALGSMAGGTFGWSAAIWSQIGWTAGVLVGSYLFAPDGPDTVNEGPRLDDLKVTTSTYGLSIPKVYGAYRISGNIIWALPLNEVKHEEKQEEGKGGGGGSTSTIWYTYTATFALALCEGPISGIRKIWFGSVLVYNNGIFGKGLNSSNITLYKGTNTQEIDWRISSNKTDTPAYRNVAYILFNDVQLEDYGNIIPSVSCEIVKNGTSTISRLSDILTPSMSSANMHYIDDDYVYSVGGYYDNTYSDVSYRFYKSPISNTFNTKNISTTYHRNVICNEGLVNEYTCEINQGIYHTPVFPMYSDTEESSLMKIANTSFQQLNIGMSCCLDPTILLEYLPVNDSSYNLFIYDGSVFYFDIALNILGKDDSISVSINSSQNWGTRNFSQFYIYNDIVYFVTLRPSEIEITTYDLYLTQIENVVVSRGITSNNEADYLGVTIVDAEGIHTFRDTGYDKVSLSFTHLSYRTGMPPIKNVNGNIAHYRNGVLYKLSNTSYATTPGPGNFNTIIERYQLNGISNSGIFLSNIVEEFLLECGLDSTDYDVSLGSSTSVSGYVMSKNMSSRAAIEPLLSAYEFSLVEFDHKIVLRKQNQPSTTNILEDDLGAEEENKIEYSIKQELDLMKSLSVRYANSISDYQTSIQQVRRIDSNAENETIVELPLALTDTEAKQLAEKMLYRTWEMRKSVKFSLPFSYRNIIAGDVVTLIFSNYSLEVRLTKIITSEDNRLICDAITNNSISYDSSAIGSNTGINNGEVSGQIGPTDFYVVDVPTLDNSYLYSEGMYVATTGYSASWKGCSIYSKTVGVDNFSLDLNLIGKPVPIGIAKTILLDGPTTIWDLDNSIDVVSNIDLVQFSTTIESMLLGNNYILIGDEVLQFKTAIDISVLPTDNLYRLSILLRGRRGTESETNFHDADEKFIFLNTSYTFGFISKTISNTSYYNAISIGDSEISNTQEIQYLGKNLKPFTVSYLNAKDSGSDIEVSWLRRSRYISGYMKTLPIIDNPETYNVLVNYSVNHITTTSEFIYTTAMRAIDGFSDNAFIFEITHEGIVSGDSVFVLYGYYYPIYISSLSPIAFWSFNETGSDTIAVDNTGVYNGTYVGSPNLDVKGLSLIGDSTGIQFTRGVNDSVYMPALSIDSNIGMCISFMFKDTEINPPLGLKYIYHMRGTFGYRNAVFSDGLLSLYNNDGTGTYVHQEYTKNVTYSVVMVWDLPNGTGYIYINGELKNSGPIGTSTVSKAGVTDFVGYPADVGGSSDGIIDELAVFDRILTDEEIINIHALSGI